MGQYLLNVGIIIQARMGSNRLPGKVLKKLDGKNLLEHIIFKLSKLESKVDIIIATSDLVRDDEIESFCKENKIKCFRGSENNVLQRYYFCAKQNSYEHIVRLTGDNPFIDIEELDKLIRMHIKSESDYSYSYNTLPKGVGAEVFSFDALKKSYELGKKPNHKEHVNEYIQENKELFKTKELKIDGVKNRPDVNLSVDTKEDFDRAVFVLKNLKHEYGDTIEAIELCSQYQ